MKNIINKIKKIEIDVLVLLILVTASSILIVVNAGDELWNYANAYKMFNGYKIYEDLNVIVTPLFFYIAQIFFWIFGDNLLAFRIYNIIISVTLLMLIYMMFKHLKVVRRRSIFYTTIIAYMYMNMITTGANYNILAMIPILIAINLIIKGKENPLVLGVLLFTTFMIKQNVFIYFALGILIYKLTKNQKIIDTVIELLKIYLIAAVGIIIYIIYLYIDNNLYNFINYCFLGVKEFGSKNVGFDSEGIFCICTSIMIITTTTFIINTHGLKEIFEEEKNKNIAILLSFGIPLTLMCYPIINYYHAILASTITIIELIYLVDAQFLNKIRINIKIEKIIYIIFICIIIVSCYNKLIDRVSKLKTGDNILNTEGVFYGSVISKSDYEDIEIITNYIKEQTKKNVDVKILSYRANLYMLGLNKNNEIFDLAFLGNLGKEGEAGLISEIKNSKNTLILLKTEQQQVFWQESKKAREYITSNYKQVGSIQDYTIFYID